MIPFRLNTDKFAIYQPIVASLLHCLRGRSTAGCSMFVVMTWGNLGTEFVSEIEFLHQDLNDSMAEDNAK